MPVKLPVFTGPEFPELLDYLWGWFQEISMGLAPNGMAPPTITWEALQAWQAFSRVGEIEPWEARTLVQLGMLRASISSEKNEGSARKDASSPVPRFGGGRANGAGPGLSMPRR